MILSRSKSRRAHGRLSDFASNGLTSRKRSARARRKYRMGAWWDCMTGARCPETMRSRRYSQKRIQVYSSSGFTPLAPLFGNSTFGVGERASPLIQGCNSRYSYSTPDFPQTSLRSKLEATGRRTSRRARGGCGGRHWSTYTSKRRPWAHSCCTF